MTSASEPPSSAPSRGLLAASGDEDGAKDDTIASLETRLSELDDKHQEQKFLFVLVLVVLFDAHIFSNMENWAAAFVIGLIQLFGIIVLADRCRVNTVRPFIDKMAGIAGHITNRDGA